MSEKKDYLAGDKKAKKIENKISVQEIQKLQIETWVLKEKEQKDLENRIVETLKKLNWKLTKKEILALMSRVEVSKWLDWLKLELKKDRILWDKEIPDDVLKSILDLIKESKDITQYWIEKLKLEIWSLNESKEYSIDKNIYFSSKFSWIKKYEESKLGENIIIDITGITLWVIDSTMAIFKFLLWLIKDIVLLPKQIIKKIRAR
jgi:hypothetical protein